MNSPVVQIILEAITKVSADKTLFYHVSSLTVLAYLPTGNITYVSNKLCSDFLTRYGWNQKKNFGCFKRKKEKNKKHISIIYSELRKNAHRGSGHKKIKQNYFREN